MLPDIRNEHLNEVLALQEELQGIKYNKEKRQRFSLLVSGLSENGLWLLTFSIWFCVFNFRFKPIDESKYYTVPVQDENASTFAGFIEVVRFFNRRKVTPSREGILNKFLATCDERYKDFYLSLLTKQFVKTFPLVELQSVLCLDSIDIQDIYGPIEMLQTDFSDLAYPVAITGLTTPELPLCVFAKEPHGNFSLRLDHGEFINTPTLLTADSTYASTPRFTLVGFAAALTKTQTVFHPIDYFDSLGEFRGLVNGKASEPRPYQQRIEKLRHFLKSNLLTQVSTGRVGFAHNADEVLPAVVKAMEGSACTYVCVADRNTAKTGKAYAVETRVATGIIDSFWIESGVVKGFNVWFNGELFPCSFSFEGKFNALLNSIAHVQGSPLDFIYLKLGSHKIGIGREVRYGAPTWRTKKLRGTPILIEKCILCGDTRYPHVNHGICRSCERTLYRYFLQYGSNAWIPQAGVMREKRRRSCWEATLLNNVGYRFQGHVLEAKENGEWRFKPDEAALKSYLEFKEYETRPTSDGNTTPQDQGR